MSLSIRWDILPYVGVGPVKFGLSRAQVHSLLPGPVATFEKGTEKSNPTEAYDHFGLHIFYDLNDCVECIEAWDSCPISYKEISLLKLPIERAVDELASAGLAVRYDDGYFFDDGGFALYAQNNIVEAVTVFQKGYYD